MPWEYIGGGGGQMETSGKTLSLSLSLGFRGACDIVLISLDFREESDRTKEDPTESNKFAVDNRENPGSNDGSSAHLFHRREVIR